MKRILAWILTVCMLLSILATGGFSVSFAATVTGIEDVAYAALFDGSSDIYTNTMLVNPSWALETATEGETDLVISFRGIEITEKYDAKRHFASFADAWNEWQTRNTNGGALQNSFATTVPNFVLAAGTYTESVRIVGSANIYGAQAGINPNAPEFNVSNALPTDTWAANTARGSETILAGGIYRSNMVGTSASDKTYDAVYKSAGVTSYNVVIDGVKFNGGIAFAQKDLAYNVGLARTSTVNVYNSVFENTTTGFSASGDSSRNFNDYNLENLRITGNTGRFIHMYPRVVNINAISYQNCTGNFYNGASSSSNDLWWKSTGGDRKFNFTVKGSVFANNNVRYLFMFTDYCHLNSYTMDFENNLFNDASYAATYGTFCIKSYAGAQGIPTFTANGNTFYSSTMHNTLFNGNANYQKSELNYTLNNNRIIGYKSALQNTTAEMDSFLANCSWNYDNNYYADTFTTVNDSIGKAPAFLQGYHTIDTSKFIKLDATPYYFDYAMTVGTDTVKVTGIGFEDSVYSHSIDSKNKVVSIILEKGTVIENPEFIINTDLVSCTLYDNATEKNVVTSLSTDALNEDGYGEYYLEMVYGDFDFSYIVSVQDKDAAADFKESFIDPTGEISSDAAVFLGNVTYSAGTHVIKRFGGVAYRFTVGINAFASVAEARAAGITQLILPAGEYDGIDISGSISIYGENYAYSPNAEMTDTLTTPELSTAWAGAEGSVVGDITVTGSATPTTQAGTTVLVKGITLKGVVRDKLRSKSNYKTSITFENVLYVYAGSSRPFDLRNSNATSGDGSVTNTDEFAFVGSRFDFVTKDAGRRMFEELGPSKITFDGDVFTEGYMVFGYPKWQANVTNGKYSVKNCYFKNATATIAASCFEGHASNCVHSGKTTAVEFIGNTFVDDNVFAQLYPGAYDSVVIRDNTFICTSYNNTPVVAISSTNSSYSPLNSSLLEVIEFENNKVIGFAPYLFVNNYAVEGKLAKGNGNYYAREMGDAGVEMYGLLKGCDYYLDSNMTTLASELEMVCKRENSMVNNETKSASIIIGSNETYTSDLKAKSGETFLLYEDEECLRGIACLDAKTVGDGIKVYAKVTNADNVSVVYEVYVTVGDNVLVPDTVGTANIENPYLFYAETENMPVGTKFVAKWQGTEYLFTAGENAFASVSQITNHYVQNGGTGVPNVILPAGVLNEDVVVTKTANFFGESAESTVLTSEPDTTGAVKIACVGDSITEGHGISESLRPTSSYPAQLQTKLDATYGEGAYEVGNFGFGGSTIQVQTNRETGSYTYWTYIYTVQYYQSLDFNPDIVVIMMGHNDTHEKFFTTPEGYKEQYQALIDTYTALPSNPTVVIAGCTGRVSSYRQNCLTQTIIPVQKDLAKENGLIYIDMYTPTIGLVGDTSYFVDGLHGSVKGYGLIADLIMDGMSLLLTTSERTATKTDVSVNTSLRTDAEGKIKVACIGDSLTYGDKAYKGYPVYLQEMLGDSYEVRNFGECGAIACDEDTYTNGTNWCYKGYKRYTYSKEWKPDIVIMMLGYNDQGSHLTNFHNGINWDGGADSTAAAEFYEDYKALVQEYIDLGAVVYCMGAPSSLGTSVSGIVNAYINPIINRVANELGLEYHDTFAHTNTWSADMFCGTNSSGTTDNTHFSAKGYKALATYMFDSLFSDFATQYVDDLGEIKNSAVIVDLQAGTHSAGDTVTYAWEGNKYQFVWGINAFASVAEAIAYANSIGNTKLQILVPENTIDTTISYAFEISGDVSKFTSIEVFGQNRKFDPNDKSASSTDPAADWSRNPNWDMYSEKGGTSAVARIVIPCASTDNILAGKLKFKGITMRNVVWNSERKVSNTSDLRSLDLIFENCLVDFTTTSTSGGFLFNMNSPRGASSAAKASNDSLNLKNFRIERFYFKSGKNRIMSTWNSNNNNYIDGFYYNGSLNSGYALGMFGWFQNAVNNTKADTIIQNSNFRNATITFNVAPIANNVVSAGKSTVYHVDNNVFCNTGSAITTYAKYYTDFKVRGNYFIQTNATSVFANNGTHTATDVDYVSTIGYEATNNTFVLADLTKYSGITLNSVTKADLTGSYVALYTADYATAATGTAPAYGVSDYYYLDYARTVKNTDLDVVALDLESDVDSVVIEGRQIAVEAEYGKKISNLGVTAKGDNVNTKWYSDYDCTTEVNIIDLDTDESLKTYYLKSSFGAESIIYTVKFKMGNVPAFTETFTDDSGIIKNTAVALIPSASTKTSGDTVYASWQSGYYSFVYGVNAFASMEEIRTAFDKQSVQIIMPAGLYNLQLTVYDSWEVYGEGYNTNPNDTSKDEWTYNTEWEKYGITEINNRNVVIDSQATPTSEAGTKIVIAGIKMTRYYNDANRDISNYVTDITLENCVYERKYLTGDSREFNCLNKNNKNTDTSYTNSDRFTIRNLHFINANVDATHALIQEMGAAHITLDGICFPDNAPSWGYPKVTVTAKSHSFTLTNSYIKGHKDASSRFPMFVSFSGVNTTSSSEQYANSTLNITNNKFVNCGNDYDGGETSRSVIEIFPAAYGEINVTGNEVISQNDYDYNFIQWGSINYAVNTGDYSEHITFKNNKLIGVMAAVNVNAQTEIDLSDNYFAKYTSGYKTAPGDTPADTYANVYLDYAMTVKANDMIPASQNVSGLAVSDYNRALYGYANSGKVILDFAKDGVNYTYYSDSALTNAITEVTLTNGEATRVYVKSVKGSVSVVYELWLMGVSDVTAIQGAEVDGEIGAVYYPTLYGAPYGIVAYAEYNGTLYGFTTGKKVVTTYAQMTTFGSDVVIPDNITEIGTKLGGANILSANGVTYTNGGTIKVACVGDSITEGVGSSTGNYPSFLQSTLGTDNFEVRNFGKSAATVQVLNTSAERGYTVFAKAQYDASIAYNPDVVIFALGTNDLYATRWKANDDYINSYIELIRSYQALDSKPTVYVTTALKRADNAMMNTRLESNLLALQKYVAKAVGANVIDTYTVMAPYLDGTTVYFADKLHPTSAGYEIMAGYIGSEINADIDTVVKSVTGSAGPNATYSFNTLTGVLTIEGTGEVWRGVEAQYKGQVKEIVIGEGITTLTDCLFCDYFTSLEKITLPSTLTAINNWVFYGTKIKEIALPAALTKIGDSAFAGVTLDNATYSGTRNQWNDIEIGINNEALNRVVFAGETVTAITETAQWTYDGVDTLYISGTGYSPEYTAESPMIPDGIAQNIKHIVIDDTFSGFGAYSFVNLTNLETVTGGSNMRYVGIWAFKGLTKLKTVEFLGADLLGILGYGAFANCSLLNNVTLSSSLKVMGGCAFRNCVSLENIVIPENIRTVEHYIFAGCTSLKTVETKGAAEIGNNAFYGCTALQNVTLNGGLETIGVWAFAGANIDTIHISESITNIGDYAFYWTVIGNATGDISNATIGMHNSWITDKF